MFLFNNFQLRFVQKSLIYAFSPSFIAAPAVLIKVQTFEKLSFFYRGEKKIHKMNVFDKYTLAFRHSVQPKNAANKSRSQL